MSRNVSAPRYDESSLADTGLEHAGTDREVAVSAPVVTVTALTRLYEHPAWRPVLDGAGPAKPPRSAFATKLAFDPPITDVPGVGVPSAVVGPAATYAGEEFADGLREDGLRGVRQVDRQRARLPTCEGRTLVYETTYPHERGDVSCRVRATLWPTDRTFLLAGSAFPTALPDSLADDDAVPALDPERHRRETRGLVRELVRRTTSE